MNFNKIASQALENLDWWIDCLVSADLRCGTAVECGYAIGEEIECFRLNGWDNSRAPSFSEIV